MNLTWKILLFFAIFQIVAAYGRDNDDNKYLQICEDKDITTNDQYFSCLLRELVREGLHRTKSIVTLAKRIWKLDGSQIGNNTLLICVNKDLKNKTSLMHSENNMVFYTGSQEFYNFCRQLADPYYSFDSQEPGEFIKIKMDCMCSRGEFTEVFNHTVLFIVMLVIPALLLCICCLCHQICATEKIHPRQEMPMVLVRGIDKQQNDSGINV
ncbi:unnamed protein product [Caenorhabditis angaria]|uniref:CX domain-containing protein n=1 Tax=Caenorhabditis angaria TaxID=860376 RepID=A0A9P1IXN3_9PELO|nr:unnamed protein product [Caenorhabditis angaria]